MRPLLLAALTGALTLDLTALWSRPAPRLPGREPSTRREFTTNPTPPATVTMPAPLAVTSGVVLAVLGGLTMMSPLIGVGASVVLAGVLLRSRRAHQRQQQAARHAAVPELIDALVALIRAGLTPRLAWCELPTCSPPALTPFVDRVRHALDNGATFADALSRALDDAPPATRGLFDALVTAERYGLPLVPALDRLASDAAAERRRLTDSRARQLPVRMAVPLVLCTLPSFVVLGIVPVLIATLSSLTRP